MKSLLCMNAFSEIIELNLVIATFVVFILLLEFGAKKYALTNIILLPFFSRLECDAQGYFEWVTYYIEE